MRPMTSTIIPATDRATLPPNADLSSAIGFFLASRDAAMPRLSFKVPHASFIGTRPGPPPPSGPCEPFPSTPSFAPYRMPVDLLAYAGEAMNDVDAPNRADARGIVERACRDRQSDIDAGGIQVRTLASIPCVTADHDVLDCAVRALLDVAIVAVPRGGYIDMMVRQRDVVEVVVSYASPPTAALRARSGRRLASRELTLEIAPAILATFDHACEVVKAHGGSVFIEGDDSGTTIRVALPFDQDFAGVMSLPHCA